MSPWQSFRFHGFHGCVLCGRLLYLPGKGQPTKQKGGVEGIRRSFPSPVNGHQDESRDDDDVPMVAPVGVEPSTAMNLDPFDPEAEDDDVNLRVYRRTDLHAKRFRGTTSKGPEWSRVTRRVTKTLDGRETLEDVEVKGPMEEYLGPCR